MKNFHFHFGLLTARSNDFVWTNWRNNGTVSYIFEHSSNVVYTYTWLKNPQNSPVHMTEIDFDSVDSVITQQTLVVMWSLNGPHALSVTHQITILHVGVIIFDHEKFWNFVLMYKGIGHNTVNEWEKWDVINEKN
jgi:hypothetical protein